MRGKTLSPSFSGEDPCPIACTEAGVSPGNWTVYHSVDRLSYCNSSLILSFSAFSPLDDPNVGNTLRACAVPNIGQDNAVHSVRDGSSRTATVPKSARAQTASFNETTVLNNKQPTSAQALWNTESPELVQTNIPALAEQLQTFLDVMDASEADNIPRLLFIHDSASSTSIGIYAGSGVTTSPLVSTLSAHVSEKGYYGDALVQACKAIRVNSTIASNSTLSNGYERAIFAAVGIAASSGPNSLAKAQRAVSRWANSSCVTEGYAHESTLPTSLETVVLAKRRGTGSQLVKRGTCSTTTVYSGDLCADLAKRCGISTAELLKYNSKSDFCTTLRVPQLVCCSEGKLPVPEPDSNGNCKPHEVHADESCWSIANDNSLLFSPDDLEKYNKKTWGWGGCKNLQANTIICLSPGSPPLPKPVPNAMCGPVKPGTIAPPYGTDLATLNPCPLNSCCNTWGFCGTTGEFCLPLPEGQAPGAPQPIGAPNCISNCGTDIVNNGSPPSSFISIGYFEGYGISRRCQAVDIRNIDMSKYTHIHFAFATITPGSYDVNMADIINQYYYFKRLQGVKKILSFGGWTFSTDPATYRIFREGVLGASRDRMAQNIANFIISEGLDGVDIDWEYPAAPDIPDIPDIPTADPEEGENYYLFLQKLRSLLPSDKSVSFAAPASFWYLRGFPIAKIVEVVDYIVYMTYDLHGQWDYGNKWTDPGCPGGNCLRSHLNATETLNALSMITKAGVPTNKIAVGIASYGRSFQMTDPQCTGPMCTYTGKASGATPGRCTNTAGYISNAEIREILANNPTARKLSDDNGADMLVYNDDQWVSYMADDTKARRINMYRSMNFLGTTDWAISLDNAGLLDEDSGGDDADNDGSDGSGDLGLGRFPGLVFEERKLGKGAVQPTYHKGCKKYKKEMQESWLESGEIADAAIKYSPDNKFQSALDIYFGGQSAKEPERFLIFASSKRDGRSEPAQVDNDEDYKAWKSELEKAEEAFQNNYDPALLDPADFEPLFDEGELTHEMKTECIEARWFTTLQCSLLCQGGLCTETYDGYVVCSSCNATTDEHPYKREEFHDNFTDTNMSDWKVYGGKFQVSSAGLDAEAATEGEAIVYSHKMADFIFEADLSFSVTGASGNAGLVFRATQPDDAELGHRVSNYFAGVSPSSGHVFLNRGPDNVQLSSAKVDMQVGKTMHIKVQAVNETISVYVGDMSTPKIVQKDATFEDGFNGVQVHNTSATFSNVQMIPVVRQRGILDSCSSFYRATAEDTCQTIAAEHTAISLAQFHKWNPALGDDCAGLKTDYFYCVAQESAFSLKSKYHNDCTGDVHNDVVVGHDEGLCIDTGCAVASLDIASTGGCPNGQVQISYWEKPGCTGKWFGYGYGSRDTCRSLWTDGWKFGALHLRCAEPLSDCENQYSCKADPEPARGICEAPPKDPPAAFTLKAKTGADCGGSVHKELSVARDGGGACLNTGCHVGSLEIAELGDCPDGEIRISYWGGENCASS
ncbi:hypothetical protein NLG97_g1065 [Lecanicillium saksenae]|uniref:Uncharacterized protein n=1 Tax=Lecanicillium saksenae TaxID=468837 RepID=A0ACC1R4T4_9HYPO|nr:hypothetical protein NLG97_g1065 [Lecanicillium saksenae]